LFIGLTACDSAAASQHRIGKEVVFREREASLQKYGYQSLGLRPAPAERLDYDKFVGKKGTVTGVVKQSVFEFWQIRLETGDTVYAMKSNVFPDQIDGMYFTDDVTEATGRIGKSIWINQARKTARRQQLITEDRNVSYPLGHLEQVKVLGVFTKSLGHAYGGAPFFIKVERNNGEAGLIGYDQRNFFLEDPVSTSWSVSVVEAIKKQAIRLGMTRDQVLLSWGKPTKINRTVTAAGTSEQWVYDKQYLYLTDDKVTALQEEQ
jgi:hypothetical protein